MINIKRMGRLAVPLLALGLMAGCGSGRAPAGKHKLNPGAAALAHTSKKPPSYSPPPSPAPAGLSCNTVVDPTGWSNGPLTANQEIANLVSMLLADGIVNISAGTPSSQDTTILVGAALELNSYSGNRLAADASQFVSDEQAFNPVGPVDSSYGSALEADIRAFMKDCPKAARLGITQLR